MDTSEDLPYVSAFSSFTKQPAGTTKPLLHSRRTLHVLRACLNSNQAGFLANSEIIIVPAVFTIPAIVITIRMWLKHKEKMAGLRAPAEQNVVLEQRLIRIEQAVDAIAVEMERVGEGQRFVTRLLAERSPAQLSRPASMEHARIDTPH